MKVGNLVMIHSRRSYRDEYGLGLVMRIAVSKLCCWVFFKDIIGSNHSVDGMKWCDTDELEVISEGR